MTHNRGLTTQYRLEYNSYAAAKNRCLNPNFPYWNDYGGRGIDFSPEWQGPDGFAQFMTDMGPRPEGYSLDRIDNERGYSAENCRWASSFEQANNQRKSRTYQPRNRLTIDGKTNTLSEWSRQSGVPINRIRSRLRYGWTGERVLDPTDLRCGNGRNRNTRNKAA